MKYIDADKLKKTINRLDTETCISEEATGFYDAIDKTCDVINSLQQEQPEIGLAEFTQKMDDWKARYNHPDNIPIKATMAFTARMFYMYPNIAREWYDGLPKITQDQL